MTDGPLLTELSYRPDGARYLEAVLDQPWPAMLDSGPQGARRGRYDIVVADPVATLVTRGAVTEVWRGAVTALRREDPFALVREVLGEPSPAPGGLPFAGGVLGYFAYDLGRAIERLPALATDGEGLPELALGVYDWAVVVDHQERRAWLASHGRDARTAGRWEGLAERFDDPPRVRPGGGFQLTSPVLANLDRDDYGLRFRRVQHYLHAGDCYQVNLARRFCAGAAGDAWLAYRQLRELSPAPHGAYLQHPGARVLSNSPERFLRVSGGRVETRPIKGTRPRGGDTKTDRALAEELLASPKDHAENVMIVDLLRNDLGKTCRTGTVRTPEVCALESYATVHHLVSRVTGELGPGMSAVELLRGCFPGGSVTGAPKVRAMEVIEELEPHRRGVYCGAIGYVGFDGDMDVNIAIRTLVQSGGTVRFWAGGGIVVDSDEEAEFQETRDKAEAMMRLLRAAEARRADR